MGSFYREQKMEETRKSGRNEERERKKGNRSEKGRNKIKIRAMMGKKKEMGNKQGRIYRLIFWEAFHIGQGQDFKFYGKL